jgi:opacity protein-like surface antigen
MTSASPTRTALTAALVLALSGCAGTAAPAASTPASAAASGPASAAVSASPTVSAPAEHRIEVTVTAGQAGGDTGRVSVPLGEPVALVVTGDVADDVHVHGYDLTLPLEPGEPAELAFDATVPGVFEVELHEAGTVLLTLQVG